MTMDYKKLQPSDTISHITYKQALALIALLKKENESIHFTYYKRDNVRYITLSGIQSEQRDWWYRVKYQDLNLENK
jgi:hypothetical protein